MLTGPQTCLYDVTIMTKDKRMGWMGFGHTHFERVRGTSL